MTEEDCVYVYGKRRVSYKNMREAAEANKESGENGVPENVRILIINIIR